MTPLPRDEIELEVGPVAHGGHFVARYHSSESERGLVVFVRHALPGERVRARVTEAPGEGSSARFLRADAVEVLDASPHRVLPACGLAHADGCGGCDFQHVALPEQRRLKAAVVGEQLQRLGGLEWDVVCEPVLDPGRPETDDGLHWRTRMQYVPLPDGRLGLRKHRSHDVVEVDHCPIAAPDARVSLVGGPDARNASQEPVTEQVLGRAFQVAADGFWQVHPGAPQALVETVLGQLQPRTGERVLDLYAGVGLFSAFLAEAVGERGQVLAVESDRATVEHARHNLADLGQAEVVADRVDRWLHRSSTGPSTGSGTDPSTGSGTDLVVLDPPRAGAKRRVVRDVAALGARAVCYVACDPAALARDIAYFAESGYGLTELRCLDLFPMTHHVECVALLEKTGSDLGRSKTG